MAAKKQNKKTNSKTQQSDFYQEITDQIIEALESGVKPWACPWEVSSNSGMPENFATGNEYSGVNIMLLWMSAQKNSFSSNQWLTFKQARDLGGNVIKGERGTRITFYKTFDKEVIVDGKPEKEVVPVMKTFIVFNLDQVEGIERNDLVASVVERKEVDLREDIEAFFSATQAKISYVGQRAFYRPSTDEIYIPERDRFSSSSDLYATVMHELTHWTGSKNRLDRTKGQRFGDQDYAFEELVAELGSAFLMADFGILGEVQHESYIASWLEVLKNDNRFVFRAASQASKAHKYLKDFLVADEKQSAN